MRATWSTQTRVVRSRGGSRRIAPNVNEEPGDRLAQFRGWTSNARLEPAGDLGRVRVVIVGDHELDLGPVARRFDAEHGQAPGLHCGLERRVRARLHSAGRC